MSTRKQIDKKDWQERLQLLISGNKGRITGIDTNGSSIVEDSKLVSIDYDPPGKGDNISVQLDDYTHVIAMPRELCIIQSDNGEVAHVEVLSANGEQTTIKFL